MTETERKRIIALAKKLGDQGKWDEPETDPLNRLVRKAHNG